jgi:hypothetical protein
MLTFYIMTNSLSYIAISLSVSKDLDLDLRLERNFPLNKSMGAKNNTQVVFVIAIAELSSRKIRALRNTNTCLRMSRISWCNHCINQTETELLSLILYVWNDLRTGWYTYLKRFRRSAKFLEIISARLFPVGAESLSFFSNSSVSFSIPFSSSPTASSTSPTTKLTRCGSSSLWLLVRSWPS